MLASLQMKTLPHLPLAVMTLAVDFSAIVPIGPIRSGMRAIAPVTGGRCTGERLNASVRPGQDWFVGQADGLAIDVRLTLDSDDGATLYLSYTGAMRTTPEVMTRFRKGELLAKEDYRLTIVARFECGDPRYAWLNDALVIGVGEQTLQGPVYHLFEVAA
jgi:Protein of unknown function (DUF3237)